MNFINRCISVRKSITKLNNGIIVNTASLKSTSPNLIKKRNFTSTIVSENDTTESEEIDQEEIYQEEIDEELDLQVSASSNILLEKKIEVISKKIAEYYTPKVEKIKLEEIEKKNVSPLLKCIYLNDQANQLIGQGKFDEAETVLISGITLYEVTNQDQELRATEMEITTHQCYGYLLSNLGYIYHVKGLYIDSVKSYTKALGYLESQEDIPFFGNTLLHLSELFSLLKDNFKAIETCKKAVDVFEGTKEYLVDDRLSLALLNLSSYLSVDGKYKEALPYCQKAFSILEKSLGRNNEMVQGCATNLSKIYQELNMKEEVSNLDKLFENPLESSLKFNFDFEKDLPHIDLSKLKQEWSKQGHQRVFDIEGFYKSSTTSKKEYESFFKQLDLQGVSFGPEAGSLLKSEIESVSYAPDVLRQWKPLTFSLKNGTVEKN
ncbi:hypothetical protein ACTA71_011086 [Dictyostelium dimigraforme]